jgi:hypothetical protein
MREILPWNPARDRLFFLGRAFSRRWPTEAWLESRKLRIRLFQVSVEMDKRLSKKHTFWRQTILQNGGVSPQYKTLCYGHELQPTSVYYYPINEPTPTWAERFSPSSVSFLEQSGARLLRIGISYTRRNIAYSSIQSIKHGANLTIQSRTKQPRITKVCLLYGVNTRNA